MANPCKLDNIYKIIEHGLAVFHIDIFTGRTER